MTATPPASGGGAIEKLNAVADGRGGVAAVWEQTNGGLIHDIWAKHVNPDGSLGGPVFTPAGAKSAERPCRELNILGVQGGAITYTLLQASAVKLELFDILGRTVATLAQGYQAAGSYTAPYNHLTLPSGIYLLRLEAGGNVAVGKVVITK